MVVIYQFCCILLFIFIIALCTILSYGISLGSIGIQARLCVTIRYHSWALLRRLCHAYCTQMASWLVGGDFNEIYITQKSWVGPPEATEGCFPRGTRGLWTPNFTCQWGIIDVVCYTTRLWQSAGTFRPFCSQCHIVRCIPHCERHEPWVLQIKPPCDTCWHDEHTCFHLYWSAPILFWTQMVLW